MKFRKFIAILLILGLVIYFQSCKTIFVNNPEKKALKKQEKEDKEFAKSYSKARKDHYEIQDKETRRRMEKNLKKIKRQEKKKNKKKKKSKWDCN